MSTSFLLLLLLLNDAVLVIAVVLVLAVVAAVVAAAAAELVVLVVTGAVVLVVLVVLVLVGVVWWVPGGMIDLTRSTDCCECSASDIPRTGNELCPSFDPTPSQECKAGMRRAGNTWDAAHRQLMTTSRFAVSLTSRRTEPTLGTLRIFHIGLPFEASCPALCETKFVWRLDGPDGCPAFDDSGVDEVKRTLEESIWDNGQVLLVDIARREGLQLGPNRKMQELMQERNELVLKASSSLTTSNRAEVETRIQDINAYYSRMIEEAARTYPDIGLGAPEPGRGAENGLSLMLAILLTLTVLLVIVLIVIVLYLMRPVTAFSENDQIVIGSPVAPNQDGMKEQDTQMGGKRGWQRGKQYSQSSEWRSDSDWRSSQDQPPKYQIWQGAWSPRQRNWEARYDQVEIRETPATEADRGGSMGSAGLLQAMQKSFTIVQKQDQKLRRILKEKELRTKQFQQYKEDTKKAFAKQVQLYEADIQRLDAEYSTAMETGQVASAQVKALAVNGTPPPPARDPLQAEESWQALWHAVENAEPGLGFLQEAYDAVANSGMVRMAVHGNAAHLSSDSVTQTVRAMAVGPGPAQHVTGAAPLTRDPRQFQQPHFVATANAGASVGQVVSGPPGLGPPQYAPDGAAAFGAGAGSPPGLHHPRPVEADGYGPMEACPSDPYITSPSLVRGPSTTSPHPKRTPIKQQRPMPNIDPTGPSLADKLDQRRAIHPFGLPPGMPQQALGGTAASGAPEDLMASRGPGHPVPTFNLDGEQEIRENDPNLMES
ncbi:unnamed protein product [Symbiodinium microadriaticum]|nr:unnamed protein product [Symbiodinium microadriaticum]